MTPEERLAQRIERKAMGMIALAICFELVAVLCGWLGGWFLVGATGAALLAVVLCVRAGLLWSGSSSLSELLKRSPFEL